MARNKTIVVGTDFSPLSQVAIAAAVQIAKRFDAEALHVVHVVNTSSAASVFPYAVPEAQLANIYEEGAVRAKIRLEDVVIDYPTERVFRTVHLGLPARVLAETAERVSADLVVVASHGFGPIRRTILGSVAGALIRSTHCPVLVVGEDRGSVRSFETVLAAVDLSNVSGDVLTHATEMTDDGGSLIALSMYEHPLSTYDEGDILPRYLSDEEIAGVGERHKKAVAELAAKVDRDNVEVRVEVMSKAPPPVVILETAAMLRPDLIVVGTSGHNAWHRMIIGSTATKVLAEAPCPVLVVPHDPALPVE